LTIPQSSAQNNNNDLEKHKMNKQYGLKEIRNAFGHESSAAITALYDTNRTPEEVGKWVDAMDNSLKNLGELYEQRTQQHN